MLLAGRAAEEELHAEQAGTAQVVGDGLGHGLGGGQLGGADRRGLPAALVVAPLLQVTDRRTEQGGPLPLLHREQGDLQLERQELLHDHPGAGSPRPGQRPLPGGGDAFGALHHALALAGGAHHRLHHHGPAQGRCGGGQLSGAPGVGEAGGAQAQLPGGQIADAVAVHGHRRGPGGGDHGDALGFQFGQGIHRQGLDLRDHQVRPVPPHHGLQGPGVAHRHNLSQIRHLHGRGAGVAIHGDHPAAQPLGGDGHLLAQLAAAQQHQGWREGAGHGGGAGLC